MNESEVLDILESVGAFRSGHFVYTSGLHGDTYINKDAFYPYTEHTARICNAIAERFERDNVQAVIGPAIAAAILAQWTAHYLSKRNGFEVLSAYADKDGQGGFIIKRGYDKVIAGKRTLIVEDLTTTGGSIKKVVEAVRAAGAEIVGACAICNRGDVSKEDVGNPPRFEALVNIELEQWAEGECELCARGIPVNTEVGHGRDFLARKSA